MPITKVAISTIELDREESLALTNALLSYHHNPYLSPYIKKVIDKVAISPTIEIGDMCLAVLCSTINSIIADTSTRSDKVLRLAGIQYKVQQQVTARMKEILAQNRL